MTDIKAMTFVRGHGVVTAFHPEPEASVIEGNWGVNVVRGPVGWADRSGTVYGLAVGQPAQGA